MNISTILQYDSFKDEPCFIIGGGPSLADFNFKLLEEHNTIGVNKAFIKYPCTINYGMDLDFYKYISSTGNHDKKRYEIWKKWQEYEGIKVFLDTPSNQYQYGDEVYTITRREDKVISLNVAEGIYGGSNSGFGAMMLAISLGANPIYLVGLDFKVNHKDRKTHWHDGHPGQDITTMEQKFDLWKYQFEEFATPIDVMGIEVINLNKTSSLESYPKDDVKKAAKDPRKILTAAVKFEERKEELDYNLSRENIVKKYPVFATEEVNIISSPDIQTKKVKIQVQKAKEAKEAREKLIEIPEKIIK